MSSLSLEERAMLALDVYKKLFETTESFNDDHVGACAAYLMGAILAGDGCIDLWPEDPDHMAFDAFLVSCFGPTSPLWQYVTRRCGACCEPVESCICYKEEENESGTV